jgi:hypothetical protein
MCGYTINNTATTARNMVIVKSGGRRQRPRSLGISFEKRAYEEIMAEWRKLHDKEFHILH